MANQKITVQAFSHEQARYRIVKRLANLSTEALNELLVFVNFLHFREQSAKEFVKLEGLWKDVPFDITDDDIRQMRHNLTQQLLKRSEDI